MKILMEEQLELVVETDSGTLIVLEAVYDISTFNWHWCINGVKTGYYIHKSKVKDITTKKITTKTLLIEMANDLINKSTNIPNSLSHKEIRHQTFSSRYIMEMVRILVLKFYPEILL